MKGLILSSFMLLKPLITYLIIGLILSIVFAFLVQ